MCKFVEEYASKARMEGEMKGKLEGKLEGKLSTLYELVKDGVLSLAEAAKRAGMSEDSFRKMTML